MSTVKVALAGIFVLSMLLYAIFPERIRLWVLLGLSAAAGSLIGAFGYKDVHVIGTFLSTMVVGFLGWIWMLRRENDRRGKGKTTEGNTGR